MRSALDATNICDFSEDCKCRTGLLFIGAEAGCLFKFFLVMAACFSKQVWSQNGGTDYPRSLDSIVPAH